jgi:hypothetical protein
VGESKGGVKERREKSKGGVKEKVWEGEVKEW